ncbi:hypothetical protein [Sodalis sp.]|uniref:hypothetical protein n=1 Tax=Sodalis sp. (in: enterobacteria) TaxID=1898979 RepID=UPI003872DCA8
MTSACRDAGRGSFSWQTNRHLNDTLTNIHPYELGNFYDYDGNFPEIQWGQTDRHVE